MHRKPHGHDGHAYDRIFERPIRLRNIPDGLRLRSVTTTADGLDAEFTGRSVTFRPEEV
ncbi:hypothetical protein [Streptomyces sp. WAC 01325]|uniref:hypothetical protein n=1 Tax=Streptomyces sp. WAC 01325 TaxID=2203202 RepID=UPI0026DA315B|nr:hypothetical protein [Streptomyces sp. WAC 01325]